MKTVAKLLIVASLLALLFLTAGMAPDAQTQPATDGHFVISAGSFQDFPFAVGEGVKNVHLSGSFKATGGTASKVYVLVLTDSQYAEWQKPHTTPYTPANGRALYNSGDLSRGTVDLHVSDDPANYHLVFNNSPFFYPKAIETDLKWEWNEAQ